MSFLVKKVKKDKEKEEVYKIRKSVFGGEQGIKENDDFDGLDNSAVHFISYSGNIPVSCARIRVLNGKAKLERMATIKDFRGYGSGTQIMNFVQEFCKKKDIPKIYLHAQEDSIKFYEKMGFKQEGKGFLEVGIPHIKMYLEI